MFYKNRIERRLSSDLKNALKNSNDMISYLECLSNKPNLKTGDEVYQYSLQFHSPIHVGKLLELKVKMNEREFYLGTATPSVTYSWVGLCLIDDKVCEIKANMLTNEKPDNGLIKPIK